MTTSDVGEVERWLRSVSAEMTAPHDRECLLCFMCRQLDDFGCDTTLRFARRYRDLRVPRATALERRLAQVGGFCDCEVFLNGFTLHPRWWSEGQEQLPPCQGVRRGSTQPCTLWVRQRRW